jgi:hypothetical protein
MEKKTLVLPHPSPFAQSFHHRSQNPSVIIDVDSSGVNSTNRSSISTSQDLTFQLSRIPEPSKIEELSSKCSLQQRPSRNQTFESTTVRSVEAARSIDSA